MKTKNIIIDKYIILDSNGYSEEQLNNSWPNSDYKYLNLNIKIPNNYGEGIKILYDGEHYTMRYTNKPIVTLKITTWRGLSPDAIHYYGKLVFRLPSMERDDRKNYICSCFYIPMFSNDEIELTNILEQWEKDRYPDAYEYVKVGGYHGGFYSVDLVKTKGIEVFNKIFGEGWKYEVDEDY